MKPCAIFALLSDSITDFFQRFVVPAGIELARTYKGFNMATLNLMPSHFETRLPIPPRYHRVRSSDTVPLAYPRIGFRTKMTMKTHTGTRCKLWALRESNPHLRLTIEISNTNKQTWNGIMPMFYH